MDRSKEELLLQIQILEMELATANLKIKLLETQLTTKSGISAQAKAYAPIKEATEPMTKEASVPNTMAKPIEKEAQVPLSATQSALKTANFSAGEASAQKLKSSPESQASGKDKSTPVEPVSLVKTENEVQTSSGLRPITKDSDLFPESSRAPKSPKYFVVFNGPNPGIYTNQKMADNYNKHPNAIFKGYPLLTDAQEAANGYSKIWNGPKIELVTENQFINPKISFQGKLTQAQGKQKMTTIGFLPKAPTVEKPKGIKAHFSKAQFLKALSQARRSDPEAMDQEKYFTSDGKNFSQYNFCIGANPEFIYMATCLGLTKTIYLGNSFEEVKFFPKEIKNTLVHFQSKVIKEKERTLFLQVHSTIPCWDKEEQMETPFIHMEIGVASKQITFDPPKVINEELIGSDLLIKEVRNQRLKALVDKLRSFNSSSTMVVNLVAPRLIITSKSSKALKEKDAEKILKFLQPFFKGIISPDEEEAKANCKVLKAFKENHAGACCNKDDNGVQKEDAKSITSGDTAM